MYLIQIKENVLNRFVSKYEAFSVFMTKTYLQER